MARVSKEHCLLTKRAIRDGDKVMEIRVGTAVVSPEGDVDLVDGTRFALAGRRSFKELIGVPAFQLDAEEKADG